MMTQGRTRAAKQHRTKLKHDIRGRLKDKKGFPVTGFSRKFKTRARRRQKHAGRRRRVANADDTSKKSKTLAVHFCLTT